LRARRPADDGRAAAHRLRSEQREYATTSPAPPCPSRRPAPAPTCWIHLRGYLSSLIEDDRYPCAPPLLANACWLHTRRSSAAPMDDAMRARVLWPRGGGGGSTAVQTGAGGDHGIDHHQNWLRFPYVFIYLPGPVISPPPHPQVPHARGPLQAATDDGAVERGAEAAPRCHRCAASDGRGRRPPQGRSEPASPPSPPRECARGGQQHASLTTGCGWRSWD
jgi:hypothetical protein